MPGLASFEKKMRSTDLVVIGAAEQSEKKQALDVVKQAGVEFAITKGAKISGQRVRSFPTYTLFDRNGEIVYKQAGGHGKDGLSPDMVAAIELALGEPVNVLLIDVEAYREEPIARFAKRARKGRSLGRLLAQIEEKAADGTAAEKTEAELLKAEIIAYGERALAEAEEVQDEWPHRHFDMMKDLAKAFRGHEIGEKANAVYKPLKRDKQAKKEIAASRLYEELQLASEKDKKSIYRKIKKKYAETSLGRRALNEMDSEES